MGFGDIIGSVLGGGITGLLGAVITRYADYKSAELNIKVSVQKNEHEIAMKNMDYQIMKEEWAQRINIADIEADARVEVADSQAFAASYKTDVRLSNPTKLSKAQNAWLALVDGVHGLVRPGLTLYLAGVTTAVYMQASAIIKVMSISPDQAVDIYQQISSTILYLTTTVVLWWFGTRSKEKLPKIRY